MPSGHRPFFCTTAETCSSCCSCMFKTFFVWSSHAAAATRARDLVISSITAAHVGAGAVPVRLVGVSGRRCEGSLLVRRVPHERQRRGERTTGVAGILDVRPRPPRRVEDEAGHAALLVASLSP